MAWADPWWSRRWECPARSPTSDPGADVFVAWREELVTELDQRRAALGLPVVAFSQKLSDEAAD